MLASAPFRSPCFVRRLWAKLARAMVIEELYLSAKELIEAERYREARELGHQLLKMRFSGAFEILAATFRGEGALDVALTVLENGVREAPHVWSLWMQLGNYLSESGRLTEALNAYDTARSCSATDLDQIDFNEAVMRMKFGNRRRAAELFGTVYRRTEDKQLRLVSLTHRLCLMVELKEITEALMELGEAFLHESDNAELLTTMALKLLEHDDRVNALNLAKQALGLKRAGRAAEVVRRIQGEPAPSCRNFNVRLQGEVEDETGHRAPFLKTSQVYAESEEEAQSFALAFEPPDVRPTLRVLGVTDMGALSDERKGVNWSSEPDFSASD